MICNPVRHNQGIQGNHANQGSDNRHRFGNLRQRRYPSVVKNTAAVIIELNREFSLEYLLGLLNSKLITYYLFEQTPKSSNKSYPSFTSRLLKSLPIRIDKPQIRGLIGEKAAEITILKNQSPFTDTTTLESEIDQLVYELYGLTEEEIGIVENSLK